MTLAQKMKLLFRLALLVAVMASDVCTQQSTSSDFIVSSCRKSLVQLYLPAQNVLKKYVMFSAIDQTGTAHLITDTLATKCGYTISYDDWGSISFRSSLYSCYTQIQNDTSYTISVKIDIAARRDMGDAVTYIKATSCPYVWSPREIVCETNYMEVSTRRKIPVIAEGILRNEPEDWATAFTQAVGGYMSVWQVVFHLSTTQKTTMLIDAAQNIGYGVNTTDSRILLRSPYNASQAVPQKSRAVNFQYGVSYRIHPFLENLWTDNGFGVTRYTIIKDIMTPFQLRPPVLTNETIPSTQIFNVTVGTFLPDVQLVDLTVGDTVLTVPQGVDRGYVIENITQPNGSVTFVLKVPFSDEKVFKEIPPDGILFILNVTFGFTIIPYGETFTTTGTVECFIPQPIVGPCEHNAGTLSTSLGNLDPRWVIFVKDSQATEGSGLLSTNQTHSTVQVPAASGLVMNEVTSSGLSVTIPITIKDQNGNELYKAVISCDAPPSPAVCLPDGTIQVSVKKLSSLPDMDLTRLRLRDNRCGPVTIDGNMAKFSFTVDSCDTTRTFQDNLVIYQNAISYSSGDSGRPLYIMTVTCNYVTNGTLVVDYGYLDNPTPSAQTGIAPLDLVLRLSKGDRYNDFYGDAEYPVVKYLQEPLYFEVELLYSSDPQLELFLDSCWATIAPDMRSLPMWPIVDNSCEHGEPYQTIFHPVTADTRVRIPSHLKRFEVKTFTFMEGDETYTGEIYFHCDVIICDSSNLDPACTQIGSCIPARQRQGRSVDEDGDKHRLVSSRAVFLLAAQTRADKQFRNHPQ
ncbi:zona pellucida sperm-binding protein 2-like isoform X4 [Dendropsophus ebraccatus]|uniref:zona pellucida sperm-binding protein 2-like isoform X4 n=1 Tax=Dendropsophus ebraccatus TaxID=150705 RepID=UPI003831A601